MAHTQLQILTTRHRLVIDVTDNLPLIAADGQRLAQVLVNLVGNAAEFSPPWSPIIIREFSMQEGIQIDVSDDGIGIPLKIAPMFLRRFAYPARCHKRRETLTKDESSILDT